MHSFVLWLQAARPKTLFAAVAPVLLGTAFAIEDDALHVPSALLALLAALLVQVATNFANDYLDAKQGADTEERMGPTRAVAAGLISARAMQRATFLTFALAFGAGLYLIYRGGLPALVIAVASIVGGVMYTAGRFSLAYLGLGDLAVLIFFGPVAVAGTYYVQALEVTIEVVLAGLGPGLLATAILVVNNVRDVAGDRTAGKRTLIVRFGRRFGERLYAACLLGAALVPLALVLTTDDHAWALLAWAALPLGIVALRALRRLDGRALNPLLGRTSIALLAYSLLFGIGWNL